MTGMRLRDRALYVLSWALFGVLGVLLVSCGGQKSEDESIRVGLLYSLTGQMAAVEQPVVDAIMLAIDEINEAGGVLGHPVEAEVVDGGSRVDRYIEGAERLVRENRVAVIFGCGNSASRRSVRNVVESMNNLLVTPIHYEGGEVSSNVLYMGAVSNQQVLPGVSWAIQNLGTRFYIVGTDSVYSHVVNAIIKDMIYALSGEVVGESYVPLDSTLGMEALVGRIEASRPEVILNTMEGEGNLAFFRMLRKVGINSDEVPTISFNLTENMLKRLSNVDMEGDYAVWSYFQGLSNERNRKFEQAFHQKYGKGRAIDDLMVSAYVGVYLWAQAVKDAGTIEVSEVLKHLGTQSYMGPSGFMYMDLDTMGVYRPVRIGRVRSNDRFEVVWDSKVSVQPAHYAMFRTPQEWDDLINDLYEKWGREWRRGNE